MTTETVTGTTEITHVRSARPWQRQAPPAEKRVYVQRLFTRIASRYDLFNRLASCGLDQGWRRQVIERGMVRPGMRLLDVCAGTGDLALLAAAREEARGTVVGVELNGAMLALARRKSRRVKAAVEWVQGDAQLLPFQNESFDRVVVGFSTRNLSNLDDGLREMVRVLRPRGQLLILETGHPAHPIIRVGYEVFLSTVARTIGFLLTGRCWPFSYLAQSVRQFLTPREVVQRLEACETDAEHVPLSMGLASLYIARKRG